jgi:hypothetical protein
MSTAAAILNPQEAPAEAPVQNGVPPSAAPQAPQTASGWWDGFKDNELKGYLANKNYDSPETLGKAYRSLEQLLGADKAGRTVVMPKDDNDVEGRKAFYSKLGVPETPDGYKLPFPEGDDGVFSKTAANWFHEAGIPAKSAERIAANWNKFIEEQVKAGQAQDQERGTKELEALKAEWGPDFESRGELGRRGLREVGSKAGFDDNDLASLERAIGAAKTIKLFSTLGSYLQESGFAGGQANQGFGMSMQKAQERLNEIHAERASGKINDYAWKNEAEPEIEKLMKILVTRAA